LYASVRIESVLDFVANVAAPPAAVESNNCKQHVHDTVGTGAWSTKRICHFLAPSLAKAKAAPNLAQCWYNFPPQVGQRAVSPFQILKEEDGYGPNSLERERDVGE
jgi:hypothetical protein